MNKVFVRFPVSEAAMTPSLVSHVKATSKKNVFKVRILHPYTLRAVESFEVQGTLEDAIEAGTRRRLALKKTVNIKYKKIAYLAAPPRGKHTPNAKDA